MSAALRGIESTVEAMGGESGTLRSLGGHPLTHILAESYYTVVPLLYGAYYAKLGVALVSPSLTALTGQALDLDDKPDGLREAVQAFFAEQDGVWEVRVQLATDVERRTAHWGNHAGAQACLRTFRRVPGAAPWLPDP